MTMRRAATAAAILCLWIGSAITTQAQVSAQETGPATPIFYLSLPNLGATYGNWVSTPIRSKVQTLTGSPAFTQDLNWQEMLAAKAELEAAVGFPLTGEEVLGKIIKSAELHISGPQGPEGVPGIVLRLGVASQQKFDALLNQVLAQRLEASGAAETPSEDYKGAKILLIQEADTPTIYAASAKDTFTASTIKENVQKAIDGVYRVSPSGVSQLKLDRHDVEWVFNTKMFASLVSSLAPLGNSAMPQAMKMIEGYDLMAGRGKIEPGRLLIETSQAMDPASGNPMLDILNVKPTSLTALGYAAESPWLSLSANLFALDKIVNYLQQSAATSGGPAAEAQFQNSVSMLETSLGMSVRNDIAPALGPEALFSLNSLTLNPMVLFTRQPTDVSADLLLGVQIRDEAKAGALMKTIEDRLSQQLAPLMAMNAAPAAAPAPASEVFKAEMYNGVELRTVQLPMLAGWSPGYAFHGNFLLIGTTTANLKAAIDRKGGTKPSAASNAQLAGLRSQFGHSAANGVALLNTGALVAKIREIAMPMIQMQAAANPNQAMAMNGVFDVLATFGTLASSARWTGASMHKVSEISLVSPAQ